MSPTVPPALDLAALLLTIGVFIAASLSDLKTREISNKFWLVYGPGALLVFALRVIFAPDALPILLVSAGATIVVSSYYSVQRDGRSRQQSPHCLAWLCL